MALTLTERARTAVDRPGWLSVKRTRYELRNPWCALSSHPTQEAAQTAAGVVLERTPGVALTVIQIRGGAAKTVWTSRVEPMD